jgi:hypothetical protein
MPVVHQRHLNMPHLAIHKLSFLKSVKKAHAALDTNALIAERPSMLRSRAVTVVAVSTCGCLLRAVDEVAGLEDLGALRQMLHPEST